MMSHLSENIHRSGAAKRQIKKRRQESAARESEPSSSGNGLKQPAHEGTGCTLAAMRVEGNDYKPAVIAEMTARPRPERLGYALWVL
ncbi:hypothetical protein SKAU_G00429610 [Synaphobranchus kaupii]|uniref:Uncharacterized protein n=1 Tax=Synaphobranchus kaupii TaxID=118154 RepID=A0A9Q1E4E6_SYNKA|nr:hypothetical protein SKAU_G00429610 [Synaphobranchus kaupii]